MPSTAQTRRRTQGERTAATTASVLDASIDCIVERGVARTAVADIAARAGVSRSAVMYHYRSRDELILAAIEHLVHRNIEAVRNGLAALVDVDEWARIESAIDIMWDLYRAPVSLAWLELTLAARSDSNLLEMVIEQSHRFDVATTDAWGELFPALEDVPGPFYVAAPVFLHALLKGLATDSLGRETDDADSRAALTIMSLKVLLRLAATVEPDVILAELADLATRTGRSAE